MLPGMSSQPSESASYKKRYTALKRKLKLLVYEQECFVGELQKAQRKLLKVTRDRSFLLDRLLQYEKTEDSSSDSDGTASSDSDAETSTLRDLGSTKKKKALGQQLPPHQMPASSLLGSEGFSAMVAAAQAAQAQLATSSPSPSPGNSVGIKSVKDAKKRPKMTKRMNKTSPKISGLNLSPLERKGLQVQVSGHMTREELERHLEMKSAKPQFMSIDHAPHSLPDDIFSHDNSNPDG